MRRLAVTALLFFGCARPDSAAPFRLRIAAVGPLAPLSADIQFGYGVVVQWLVFEPLLHPEGGRWRARVVEGWERAGRDRFRFQLRPGVTFSDGSAVTAADIGAALGAEASVEASDGGLIARWRSPGTSVEGLLLSSTVVRSIDGGQLGTGPFEVVEEDERHMLLRRRRPSARHVSEVELVSFPTARDAFAAALRGEVNMLLMPDDGQIELLEGVDRLRLIRRPGIHSVSVLFNPARLSRDDRRALAATLTGPSTAAAYGALCTPEPSGPALNPMPLGGPIEVLVSSAPPGLMRTALAARRALGSRGGAITVVTPAEAQEKTAAGQFDVLVTTLQTWPEDFAASRWLTGAARNVTGYTNAAVDSALRAADPDEARRQLALDPPFVPLCRLERTAAVDARLVDATLGAYDLLDTLPVWQVAR